ncbi:Nuclear pore complex protein Nup160-like [Homarus americanus]|uniref:Nuclear pore complex protein Nup160-like n=1 Tax=Homarus americanus TaxID=6706 RepID=A0A8J5N8B8_HOMAM|nr:Nuclear pore complex protein Nup160-like [Homarus americanus]
MTTPGGGSAVSDNLVVAVLFSDPGAAVLQLLVVVLFSDNSWWWQCCSQTTPGGGRVLFSDNLQCCSQTTPGGGSAVLRQLLVVAVLFSDNSWSHVSVSLLGAAQSTLQDIKVPEYGGGYTFTPLSHNRCLFWRVCHDVVELWEESLDHDFCHNHVQLRFADTPVLEGLSVHETRQYVYILLATVSSVHRIRLPHPHTTQVL